MLHTCSILSETDPILLLVCFHVLQPDPGTGISPFARISFLDLSRGDTSAVSVVSTIGDKIWASSDHAATDWLVEGTAWRLPIS
jgi:hypothetical protein